MVIGIPKEIKNNENRVGMTPAGVAQLVKAGHKVYVQSTAGDGSGFSDRDFGDAGATLLPTMKAVYDIAEMIIKVKEPIEPEYELIRKGQVLFTYFHFASDEPLTKAMMKRGATCIAYETVRLSDGSLPLLSPMSEVAGKMAVQEGVRYLEKMGSGMGVLVGGVTGVKPSKVLVLGAGTVGTNAARTAAGLGAEVTIADISTARLHYLSEVLPANVHTLYSTEDNIRRELPTTDLVIGSVLKRGDKTPHLITREMLPLMRKGSVLVDVAIDQGGCFETSHPTTHTDPVYEVDGIIHYAVANIPGVVPRTSTMALTNATLPYALALANKGWKEACKADNALAQGVNMVNGEVTFKPVADLYKLPLAKIEY